MNERDWLAERFQEHRPRLRAVAYRVLGSTTEAEDAVQEAWIRLSRSNAGAIDNLEAWLVTVVGRVALDILRARKTRREEPLESHLPDPIIDSTEGIDPQNEALLADSVGLALLVVLEQLSPAERLAFVLHDMFAVPFDEIARILGKSTAAAKMLASRARKKVRTPPRPTGSSQREVVQAFLTAARDGDFEQLLRVLDPEVRLTVDTPDGLVVVLGATNVARGARFGAAADGRTVLVGGLPGVVAWRPDGTPLSLVAFTVVDGRITDIAAVADPVKLASMALPEPPGTVGGGR
jgi:RNA polymerase sigma-70 factor (ECF subfamily)